MPSMRTSQTKRKNKKRLPSDGKSKKITEEYCVEDKKIVDYYLDEKEEEEEEHEEKTREITIKSKNWKKYRNIIMIISIMIGIMAIASLMFYNETQKRFFYEIESRKWRHNEEMEKLAVERKKVDAEIIKHEAQKIIKEYEKQMGEITNKHDIDLKKITTKHDLEMEKMRTDHQLQMQRIKETQKESITKLELEHETVNKRDQLTIEKKSELFELVINGGFKDLELDRKLLELRYTECIRAREAVKSFPSSGWFFGRNEQKLQELTQYAITICKEHTEGQEKLEKRLLSIRDGSFKFEELPAN